MPTKDKTGENTHNSNSEAPHEMVQKIHRLKLVTKREEQEDGSPRLKPATESKAVKARSPRKRPQSNMPNEFDAMRKWTSIPLHFRQKILDNVYCVNCGGTSIVDYLIESHTLGIVLTGKCKKCGGVVTRCIEDE